MGWARNGIMEMILLDGKPCLFVGKPFNEPRPLTPKPLTRDMLFYLIAPYRPISTIKYCNHTDRLRVRIAICREDQLTKYFYLKIAEDPDDTDSRKTGARIRNLLMHEIARIIFKWQEDVLVLNRWARDINLPGCLQKHVGQHINHYVPSEVFDISRKHFLLCCFEIDMKLDDFILYYYLLSDMEVQALGKENHN
jgi:hypothetical protein